MGFTSLDEIAELATWQAANNASRLHIAFIFLRSS